MMNEIINRLPRAEFTDLVPLSNWSEILRIAKTLPPLSGGGFEYHLQSPINRTDFLVRIQSADWSRAALAGQYFEWPFRKDMDTNDTWERVRIFAKQWADPKSTLHNTIENVWLEFDVNGLGQGLPNPSVFFDLDRKQELTGALKTALLAKVMNGFGQRGATGILTHLQRQLERTPKNICLYYIGLMLARQSEGLRLCFAGMSPLQMIPFIKSTGWVGDYSELATLINGLPRETEKLVLNIDMNPGPGPRIGIEVFLPSTTQWRQFFMNLEEMDLCSAEESRAILAWPEETPFPDDEFRTKLSRTHGREISLLIRRLNHVKITLTSTGKTLAKTYLYYGYY